MSSSFVPAFRLRFPVGEIGLWADRYAYEDDSEAQTIGARARERGWYMRSELVKIALWKTKRSRSRVARNSATAVRDATGLALSTTDERLRVGVLTLLQGVELPTASVLLHLAHPDRYPILDFRALWSLSVNNAPSYYSFRYWDHYVQHCRKLADDAGVQMRRLDRALWQFSAEHQVST